MEESSDDSLRSLRAEEQDRRDAAGGAGKDAARHGLRASAGCGSQTDRQTGGTGLRPERFLRVCLLGLRPAEALNS